MVNKNDVENYTPWYGSVLHAGQRQTITRIYNSTFKNNYANKGGVILVNHASHVFCSECVFEDNFALVGGVALLDNEGSIEFHNSTLRGNIAIDGKPTC